MSADNFAIASEADVSSVPAGAWGVAVSGGGDSVALLELLRRRADLTLHVLHLDHETRAGQSGADAAFVVELMDRWKLSGSVARRSAIEAGMGRLEKNISARYRAARLAFFRREVEARGLSGVVLAHHAGDQAETIFQRLVRGSGVAGLRGISLRASVGGVTMLRPLLSVKRDSLRAMLRQRGIEWREDASNLSMEQQRNRVRVMLERSPELAEALIDLGRGCETVTCWLRGVSAELGETFGVSEIQRMSPLLARESLRRWLADRAGGDAEITLSAVARLFEMATDLATSPRGHFAGGLLVRRRGGRIFAERV